MRCTSSVSDSWVIPDHESNLKTSRYCVGTRRLSLLIEKHINICASLVKHHDVDNFEARMAAEVQLYWIIHERCSASEVKLDEAELALDDWRQEWSGLFCEYTLPFP